MRSHASILEGRIKIVRGRSNPRLSLIKGLKCQGPDLPLRSHQWLCFQGSFYFWLVVLTQGVPLQGARYLRRVLGGEAVEASDGVQVLMNSCCCLRWSMRESSEMRGAVGKNNENCDICTTGFMEATGVGLRDLQDK